MYSSLFSLLAKLTAERVGVDLLLDLPAQPAADGTRLVLFVNTHVFTDAGNLRFDLRKEAGFCTPQNKNGIYARRLIHAAQTVSFLSAAAHS